MSHFAVNLSGGEPQLYRCLPFTEMSKLYKIACILKPNTRPTHTEGETKGKRKSD